MSSYGHMAWIFAGCVSVFCGGLQAQAQSNSGDDAGGDAGTATLTLEQIMAHPDWLGRAPEEAWFSSDSRTIYFEQKQAGHELRDRFALALGKPDAKPVLMSRAAIAQSESAERKWSADGSMSAWINAGNVWWQRHGKPAQLMRTGDVDAILQIVGSDALIVQQGQRILQLQLPSGRISVLADLRLENAPMLAGEQSDKPHLSNEQTRLFEILRKREQRTLDSKARAQADALVADNVPAPFYLGKDTELASVSVAPNARYLLIGTLPANREGRADVMPHYVSEDGYVKAANVRSKVGSDKADAETLWLIDLSKHEQSELSFSGLPDILRDPLAELKQAQAKDKTQAITATQRAIYVHADSSDGPGIRWHKSGDKAAFMLMSYDNKSRWLVRLDVASKTLTTLHHLQDAAWVNDNEFNEFGWLADGRIYFTSEHSGYSQLYLTEKVGTGFKPLTEGKYEINQTKLSHDGRWLYFRANKNHPGNHEIYRVALNTGIIETLTQLGGENEYVLAPDEASLLLFHSAATRPVELYSQSLKSGAKALQLTDTVSAEFKAKKWLTPQIVTVPSSHGAAPIYARIYGNTENTSGPAKPAVMFVHGAGYLQNAHFGWSNYFREYMFHNLLVQQGYVVIDMDYRASAGYGRDWRTAIYQRMGTPELEDYLDGVEYLVKNANVDRQRIGIYGGSYGGFMTFMALFKTPQVFAAGAALRPVSDWAHYNHGYTSNILNTPEVDPQAYARSSPIEFAAGLQKPLLICTGMLDDNVFFQDSVRLVQRLIELKNPNFELAVYPIEPHGFREPSSWLDEYRRIYRLFERELKGRH